MHLTQNKIDSSIIGAAPIGSSYVQLTYMHSPSTFILSVCVDPIDVYVRSFQRITSRATTHFDATPFVRKWAYPAGLGHVMKSNRLSGKLNYIIWHTYASNSLVVRECKRQNLRLIDSWLFLILSTS